MSAAGSVPQAVPLATLDIWRVPTRRVPGALARQLADRRHLRHAPGLRFAKLLGTGRGRTFTPRDADLHRWALFAVWDSTEAAREFARSSPQPCAWARLADEHWRAELRPLASRGRWSGRDPFATLPPPSPATAPSTVAPSTVTDSKALREANGAPRSRPRLHQDSFAPQSAARSAASGGEATGDAPVAVITRARLTTRHTATFWRAVPPVAADLARAPGLRLALGVGEAPIGLQGTFSLWDNAAALRAFAYRRPAHLAAIERTTAVGWYAEELFARFAVVGSTGTVNGQDPATTAQETTAQRR